MAVTAAVSGFAPGRAGIVPPDGYYFTADAEVSAASVPEPGSFTEPDLRQELVSTAESYLGQLEYALIGGSSDIDGSKQADCSGFIWQIYGKCGAGEAYKGYHTCQEAMELALDGSVSYIYEISLEEILPGDLVIYECSEESIRENPERIYGHMGLYAGDGEIIHCTRGIGGHNGCIRSRIDYRDTPVHAVRIDLAAAVSKR